MTRTPYPEPFPIDGEFADAIDAAQIAKNLQFIQAASQDELRALLDAGTTRSFELVRLARFGLVRGVFRLEPDGPPEPVAVTERGADFLARWGSR